jgi:transcriptional regulator with XRE-family HTH domain
VGSRLNPIDAHVGKCLRTRRAALHMSQGALGDALGVTFQQVQKYENGINRVSASRLHHLAHILQVPVAFFFEGAPGQQTAANGASSFGYVSEFVSSRDGIALVRAFARLDSKQKRRIVDLVEEIARYKESGDVVR